MRKLIKALAIGVLSFAYAVKAEPNMSPPPPPPPAEGSSNVDVREFEMYLPEPKEVKSFKEYERKILEELVSKHKVRFSTLARLYIPSQSTSVSLYPLISTVFLFSDKVDRVYTSFNTKQLDIYNNMVVVVPDENFLSGNIVVVYGKNVVSIIVENVLNSYFTEKTLYSVIKVKEDRTSLSLNEKVEILDSFLKKYGKYPSGEVTFVYKGERFIIKRLSNPINNAISINGKFFDVIPIETNYTWVE